MNYDRIYEYRFKDVDREKKLMTWKEIVKTKRDPLAKFFGDEK